MSRTLRIVERARIDVEEIFNWLVHRSMRGAISWYLAFYRAVDTIAAAPEAFGEASEAVLLGRWLHQSIFKTRRGRTYRIIFELSDAEIIQRPLKGRELPNE